MRSVRLFTGGLLVAGGALALLWAAGTLAYGEVFGRYASWQFERRVVTAEETDVAVRGASVDRTAAPEDAERRLRRGDEFGRLEIPRLGLSVMVFLGVEPDTLEVGAGHVPGTPLPGAEGNSAIAAHRDRHFRKLKDIRRGDVIQVSTLSRTHDFVVEWTEIVGPDETRVLESHNPGSELTLITCYPFYFVGAAPERFVVRARQVSE